MKLKSLIITSALLLAACGYTQAQSTQVIAHRGFWKTDGSAQNSIAALVKARLHKLLRFRVRCMAHRRQPTCSKPR